MQSAGQKIKLIARQKGLVLEVVGNYAGYKKTSWGRKLNDGKPFSNKVLTRIAEYLGVTPEYLRDTSRPFNPGDTIPPDALATPTPITTTPSDLTEMARIFERQAADIKKSKEELRDTEFNAMREMQRQMAEILQEVSGNTRVMSANVLALAEIVKELKEERGGEHDTD